MATEASIGCPIPDLRLSRPKIFSQTTEQPYVTYIETTQIYLPEDLTTSDFNSIENIEQIENLSENTQRQTRYTDFNPYAWGDSIDGGGRGQPMFGGTTTIDDQHYDELTGGNQQSQHNKPQNIKNERRKPRKNSSGRRRLDRHNQGHKQSKREIKVITSNKKIYYVQSLDDILKLQKFYETLNKTSTNESNVNNTNLKNWHHHQHHHRRRGRGLYQHQFISNENIEDDIYNHTTFNAVENNLIIKQFNNTVDENVDDDAVVKNIQDENTNGLHSNNDTINIRTKRKSGKTTGALRPKTGSEASSKTPSRKKEGKINFNFF